MTVEPEIEAPREQTEAEKARDARMLAAADEAIALSAVEAGKPENIERAKKAMEDAGSPVWFAMTMLGIPLYRWQAIVLDWFSNTLKRIKGSLCTPNGAGKSACIDAPLALWWINAHPQGRVVITTKDSKQLDNQLWPAITAHKEKFPQFDFIERMVRNPYGGFIIGFTTDDPGRAEGWHKLNDFTGPLLIIGDEAKSIANGIHMALDRCRFNAKLLTSSPGLTEGTFYESQTRLAHKVFKPDGSSTDGPAGPTGFLAMKVGLMDCPHIEKERIDDIIETYGADHWFTRSTLHAEFTDVDSDTLFVIPKHIVRHAMDNPPRYVPGGKVASCDFAAGRAENVFTIKQGNKIDQVCWKDMDTMRAVNRFVELFNEHGLLPSEIYGDAGGMGIPLLHRFNQLGWPINPVNNESEPMDPLRYPNKGAEQWHEGAVKLAKFDLIIPNDPILFDQLTQRRAAPTSDAILGLEKKRDMQKRGIASPDRADGLVMVLAAETSLANTLFDAEGLEKLEKAARAMARPEIGSLDLTGDRITYTKRLDGFLNTYERPVVGFEYICILNPYRFEEQLKNHVLIVIRAPRWDNESKKEVPARLACRVRLNPFRLDARPLALMVTQLANWYGKCLVVPVVNDRGDIIEHLVNEGAHVYSREEFELLGSGRKKQFEYGWESDNFTRSLWLGALSEKIREDGIVCEDVIPVMQLYQLNPKAPSAMREAEALGVGLQLMNHATTYCAPVRGNGSSRVKASQYG